MFNKKLLLMCTSIVALSSVTIANQVTEIQGSGLTFDEFKNKIERDSQGVYIVEGDLPISTEEKLRDYYNNTVVPTSNGELIINTNNGRRDSWDETQRMNITYCVSTTFGDDYATVVNAMDSAANEWENTAYIDFIHLSEHDNDCTNTNDNIVFDVNPSADSAGFLARAFFPSEQRNVRNILINRNSAIEPNIPDLTLTGILRHELGHTLGFRHEHTREEADAPDCVENNNWEILTDYDSNSVMHYPQCNGTGGWALNLTDFDREGASMIYAPPGVPPVAILNQSSSSVLLGSSVIFDASASFDPNGQSIGYQLNLGDGTGSNTMITEHTYENRGTYDVRLVVIDEDASVDFDTTSVNVYGYEILLPAIISPRL